MILGYYSKKKHTEKSVSRFVNSKEKDTRKVVFYFISIKIPDFSWVDPVTYLLHFTYCTVYNMYYTRTVDNCYKEFALFKDILYLLTVLVYSIYKLAKYAK